MPETSTAVVKTDNKEMTYVPFGGTEEIKLSISIVKNLIAVKTKEGHTCSDNDAIKFLMMCQARKLNPFEGDAFLIGYDSRDKGPTFSLITAHQAFLKRAELNKEYDGMKSGVIVLENDVLKDLEGDFHSTSQKPVGGWATVYFKNRTHPMHKRVRLSRFQKAFGVWQDDPAGMIVKCAEADALRSSFPTMLGGLYLKEETEVHTGPAASAPIFKDDKTPVQEAEVADDPPAPPKAPAPSAAPPVVPVPKAKPPKTPEPAKTPPAPKEEPKMLTELQTIQQRMAKDGYKTEQLIRFLVEMGNINESTATLEEIALESPEVISMVFSQYEDIFERISNI